MVWWNVWIDARCPSMDPLLLGSVSEIAPITMLSMPRALHAYRLVLRVISWSLIYYARSALMAIALQIY